MAGRAAGNIIVDLLHFSSLDKMEQMVAWSSFLASRCQGPSATMLPITDSIFIKFEESKMDQLSPIIVASKGVQLHTPILVLLCQEKVAV